MLMHVKYLGQYMVYFVLSVIIMTKIGFPWHTWNVSSLNIETR